MNMRAGTPDNLPPKTLILDDKACQKRWPVSIELFQLQLLFVAHIASQLS